MDLPGPAVAEPRLGPLLQVLVPVSDLDRAIEFYARVLGLPLQMRFPGVAFLDLHGVRLYLARPTEADFAGRATFYVRVDDVTGTLEALEARGAPVRERPGIVFREGSYDLWLAFVQDPDGNNIGLMREAPPGLARG